METTDSQQNLTSNAFPFISAEALEKLISAGSVQVLDCSVAMPKASKTAEEDYLNGHIPTAHFMDLENCRDKSSAFMHMIPPLSQFKDHMAGLGVGLDTLIVTYDITDGRFASRGAYLLKYFGHTNVRILDGGNTAWVK